MAVPITKTDFKAYFDRDFSFGADANTVRDSDIDKALAEAAMVYNAALWGSSDEGKIAYEYLTAHCLVTALRNNGGLGVQKKGTSSSGGGPISGKSAGPLSVNYALSGFVTESPALAQLMETGYGQKYLAMLEPRLIGNVVCVEGATQP